MVNDPRKLYGMTILVVVHLPFLNQHYFMGFLWFFSTMPWWHPMSKNRCSESFPSKKAFKFLSLDQHGSHEKQRRISVHPFFSYISLYPIPSMGLVYLYLLIYLPWKSTKYVGKYTSPMDGMGISSTGYGWDEPSTCWGSEASLGNQLVKTVVVSKRLKGMCHGSRQFIATFPAGWSPRKVV